MGQAIGGSLPLAIGIALSPVPIIAVVLMLTSRKARVNGPAFTAGWLTGLGAIGVIVLAAAGAGSASKWRPGIRPNRVICVAALMARWRPTSGSAGVRARTGWPARAR